MSQSPDSKTHGNIHDLYIHSLGAYDDALLTGGSSVPAPAAAGAAASDAGRTADLA